MKRIAILFFLLIVSSSIFAYTVVGGNITGTVTWVAGTYYATSDLVVNYAATLTLNPGVVIKFAPGIQFKVTGILYANGTNLTPSGAIVFTSRDDNTHGETIAESDGIPNSGDWEGFWFDGTQSSYPGRGEFDYSIIRYGGNVSGFGDANLFMNKGSGFFNNGICEYSATHGLRYRDTDITISNNTINNNTDNGVMLESSSSTTTPNVFGNTFTSNGSYAANLQAGRVGNISGNSGSGNGINGFGISGAIISNQTWTGYSGNFPIILLGQVNVNNTYTLTIPASTIIKAEANGEIHVGGTIDVNGGNSSAVIFTSYKDDTYGGDTYGDGSTTPSPGDWKGIIVSNSGNYSNADGGKGYFDYCIIRYGGNSSSTYDANLAFTVSTHTGTITGCVIEQSVNNGIYSFDSYVKIRSSRIINNGTNGVSGKHSYYNGNVDLGNATPDEGNNRITGNGSYAIYNDGYTILAENNYWGVTTTGEIAAMINNVSGSVDYDPWLSSDPTIAPTPVELTSFTATSILRLTQQQRSKERNYSVAIRLNWTTATEVNNYGFEVERAVEDGHAHPTEEWKTLSFIEGHGNSNSPKEYSFVDSDKLSGTVQYRLKQIDTDGSFEYSNIVEVKIDLQKEFNLLQNYPNPFNPSTTISYALPYDSKVSVEIFNVLGQRVGVIASGVESAGLHSTLWDAGHLASGIYIIRINATSVSSDANFVKSIKMLLLK